MAERWLRWYDGTVRDGKFRLVANRCKTSVAMVVAMWASILEDACTSEPRGKIRNGTEYHAEWLDIDGELAAKIWGSMIDVGLITKYPVLIRSRTDDGTAGTVPSVPDNKRAFMVTNWGSRQYETDAKDPTAKARKDRWKQGHSNISQLTVPERSMERLGTPESESESESERKSLPPQAAGHAPLSGEGSKQETPPAGFAEFWLAYPKKVSKPAALRAWRQAIKRASSETIMDGLRAQVPTFDPNFTKNPATWLNNDCWNDPVPKKPEWSLML